MRLGLGLITCSLSASAMATGSGPSCSGKPFGEVRCRYHPEEPLVEDHSAGDMICPKCGLVVGDR